MSIVPPVWYLRRECPSCGQGSSLTYLKCDSCGSLHLVCEEEQLEFLDCSTTDFATRVLDNTCRICLNVNCLSTAASDDLQSLGYEPIDYQ